MGVLDFIKPYILWLKVATYIAAFLAGMWLSHTIETANKARESEAYQKKLTDQIEKSKKAEEQHDKDQSTINNLSHELNRMRVHLPTVSTKTSDKDVSCRAFSRKVDEEFGRLQESATVLFSQCDQLNIDAIRSNAIK